MTVALRDPLGWGRRRVVQRPRVERASSSFWYCRGVVAVIVLKCLPNDDALIPTRRARSGIVID
jgi:hypothetical protein